MTFGSSPHNRFTDIREVSSSSRNGASSLRRRNSVIRKTKSSPEAGQHESERVSPRLIRRKGISASVEIADDSDMWDDKGPWSAGLATPPAESGRELGGGLNLEQAMSLLQAEKGAYIELQRRAFADAAAERCHLEAEEQQCKGCS